MSGTRSLKQEISLTAAYFLPAFASIFRAVWPAPGPIYAFPAINTARRNAALRQGSSLGRIEVLAEAYGRPPLSAPQHIAILPIQNRKKPAPRLANNLSLFQYAGAESRVSCARSSASSGSPRSLRGCGEQKFGVFLKPAALLRSTSLKAFTLKAAEKDLWFGQN